MVVGLNERDVRAIIGGVFFLLLCASYSAGIEHGKRVALKTAYKVYKSQVWSEHAQEVMRNERTGRIER